MILDAKISKVNHDNTMKNLLVIFFLFFVLNSYSQNKEPRYKDADVNIIQVVDPSFYRLLDEILLCESRCSYYTDSLPYGITIIKSLTIEGDSVIVLGIAGYSEKGIFIENNRHLTGCFFYKGHDFFIDRRNILPAIVLTDNKKTIKYNENYYVTEDDSWTIYNYIYYDNKFTFYQKVDGFRCGNCNIR